MAENESELEQELEDDMGEEEPEEEENLELNESEEEDDIYVDVSMTDSYDESRRTLINSVERNIGDSEDEALIDSDYCFCFETLKYLLRFIKFCSNNSLI